MTLNDLPKVFSALSVSTIFQKGFHAFGNMLDCLIIIKYQLLFKTGERDLFMQDSCYIRFLVSPYPLKKHCKKVSVILLPSIAFSSFLCFFISFIISLFFFADIEALPLWLLLIRNVHQRRMYQLSSYQGIVNLPISQPFNSQDPIGNSHHLMPCLPCTGQFGLIPKKTPSS